MAKKKISIANFNVVFFDGKEEKSLLDYFDTIFMPAINQNIVRRSGDSTYRLMEVKIMESEKGYVLTGVLVKQTVLEIKSDLDESGNLIEKDEKIPTAPYSTFAIYLKNHRMIYAENQKGSPDLRSFRATICYFMNRYVSNLQKETEEELPIPIINVVGIPTRQKLSDTLKEVEKVNELILRFYPLNGDLDFSGLFNGLSTDLRKLVGSKKGEIVLKSPQNIEGIIEVVDKSEGTVEPIFHVQYPGKKKSTIKNDKISERTEMDIESDTIEEEVMKVMEKTENSKSLNYVSEGNREIYRKNRSKIIPFVKR